MSAWSAPVDERCGSVSSKTAGIESDAWELDVGDALVLLLCERGWCSEGNAVMPGADEAESRRRLRLFVLAAASPLLRSGEWLLLLSEVRCKAVLDDEEASWSASSR